MGAGSAEMLPDERTTHRNELPLPSDAEGLVVAPDRAIARPLISFLRGQGLSVRTADDADSAFEEALLHPPDVVLVDDRVPPTGGVDAVFAPSTDAQERRARLWALLRTRALHRRAERSHRTQQTEIVER